MSRKHGQGGILLQYRFRALPSELSELRQQLRATLEQHCRSESLINCIILAVGEACMNIIQHAYGNEDRGDIVLEVRSNADSLTFRLTDFAQRKSCIEEMRSRPLDELRPGGLGCHLINEIMDEVTLIDCGGSCGNVLQMKKRLV
jgi:anti-sigma regulatory factor (Ser/Thr protein kinase)